MLLESETLQVNGFKYFFCFFCLFLINGEKKERTQRALIEFILKCLVGCFTGGSVVKESYWNSEDVSLITGSENPTDREACQATVLGFTKRQSWSDWAVK